MCSTSTSISTTNATLDNEATIWHARKSKVANSQIQNRPAIELKSPEQIEAMRVAGHVLRRTLEAAEELCVAGATTLDVDRAVAAVIADAGADALFLNYPSYRNGEGFPSSACISVNEEIVHGIPGNRILCDGDIVTIDCGVRLDGWCADAATTVGIGTVDDDVAVMVNCADAILSLAIDQMRPGRRWSEIARMMQETAEKAGFGVVRDYVGHGIGREMHEQPQAPGFVTEQFLKEHDFVLEEGMTLAVEPMLTLGIPETITLDDGWTVITADIMPSCHSEHTIAITSVGTSVLTAGY